MEPFEFFCQYCGQRLQATRDSVGRLAECPACQSRVRIPAPVSQATLTPVTVLQPTDEFEFKCPACRQALSARAQDVGADVACPACDNIFAIPDPSARAAVASPRQTPANLVNAPPQLDDDASASSSSSTVRNRAGSSMARKLGAGARRKAGGGAARSRTQSGRQRTAGAGAGVRSDRDRRSRPSRESKPKTRNGGEPEPDDNGTEETLEQKLERWARRPVDPRTGGRGFILLEDRPAPSQGDVGMTDVEEPDEPMSPAATPRRRASAAGPPQAAPPSPPPAPAPAPAPPPAPVPPPAPAPATAPAAAASPTGRPPSAEEVPPEDVVPQEPEPDDQMEVESAAEIVTAAMHAAVARDDDYQDEPEGSGEYDDYEDDPEPVSDEEWASSQALTASQSDAAPEESQDDAAAAVDALFAGVDEQFGFSEADRALDTFGVLSETSNRPKSLPESRRLASEGSVAVIPTVSDNFASKAQDELFTDEQAQRLMISAARVAIEDMEATNDCAVLLEPPDETRVADMPTPQFFGYVRPSPADTRNAWCFVFFHSHLLAYELATRKLTVLRSPDFDLDVRFKPGIESVSKTHLGFLLKKGEQQVCLMKLAFKPNGMLATAARDFSLQVKNWIKHHPVLGRRMQERLQQVTSARQQARKNARSR